MEAKKENEKKDTGTRKCGCPFALKGQFLGDNRWKVEVVCGNHNHHLSRILEGHPYAARLTREERKIMKDMSLIGVKLSQILKTLKSRGMNVSTIKTIYNCKLKLRLQDSEGRTVVQQLLHLLEAKYYAYWLRENMELNEVEDIFWTHPESILLAKCFPRILLKDCIYKTNRYKMPLLQNIGMTSTGRKFTAANAFLRSENEDNYECVLSNLRPLFDPRAIPSVIVTDREQAFMNAIDIIFPDADHLLCMLHISKNVEQHCKSVFKTNVVWKNFFDIL